MLWILENSSGSPSSQDRFSIEKRKEPPPTNTTSTISPVLMPFHMLLQIVLPSKYPPTVSILTLEFPLLVDSRVPFKIKLSLKDPVAPITTVLYFP